MNPSGYQKKSCLQIVVTPKED